MAKARTRIFGGKRYSFVRRCAMKFDADKIAKARKLLGLKTRITKVKIPGLRGVGYEVWGAN